MVFGKGHRLQAKELLMKQKVRKKYRLEFSVWVVISIIAVMAIISAVLTLSHFQRQKEQAIKLARRKRGDLNPLLRSRISHSGKYKG